MAVGQTQDSLPLPQKSLCRRFHKCLLKKRKEKNILSKQQITLKDAVP
jgi:hypothetical protein